MRTDRKFSAFRAPSQNVIKGRQPEFPANFIISLYAMWRYILSLSPSPALLLFFFSFFLILKQGLKLFSKHKSFYSNEFGKVLAVQNLVAYVPISLLSPIILQISKTGQEPHNNFNFTIYCYFFPPLLDFDPDTKYSYHLFVLSLMKADP